MNQGTLLLTASDGNSRTVKGTVNVNAGTLGGGGVVGGAATIGDGIGTDAFLSPSEEVNVRKTLAIRGLLTVQGDASYLYRLDTTLSRGDSVAANGVTIKSNAVFSLIDTGGGVLLAGTVFTAIRNGAETPIAGTFGNLADGSTIVVGNNSYLVSYEGGDGNDLTLTVVP